MATGYAARHRRSCCPRELVVLAWCFPGRRTSQLNAPPVIQQSSFWKRSELSARTFGAPQSLPLG